MHDPSNAANRILDIFADRGSGPNDLMVYSSLRKRFLTSGDNCTPDRFDAGSMFALKMGWIVHVDKMFVRLTEAGYAAMVDREPRPAPFLLVKSA